MRKRLGIFLIVLCVGHLGNAQIMDLLQLGAEVNGGISILGVKSDFEDGSRFEKYLNPITSSLLLRVDYPITPDIHLSSGLGITTKGVALNYFEGSDSSYKVLWGAFNQKLQYNVTYLRLPITGKYYYDLFDDPNMIPFGEFGTAIDFRLNNGGPSGNGIDHTLDFNYHKGPDINLVFGAGVEIKTRSNNDLAIGIRIAKGWNNTVTDSYGDAKSLVRLRNNQVLFFAQLRIPDMF